MYRYHNFSDAAAMAVTAPTYVLEESLSSQKLWKYTAGNRPPQPVEERAFYEQMWSQNFARSKVDYNVPVEVLTATTPISMSPFADGSFDTSNAMAAVAAAESGSKSKTPSAAIAEATLQNMQSSEIINSNSRDTVVHKTVKGSSSEGDITVLIKGDNVFGTTVSKSFARPSVNGGPVVGVDTVNISIASYRVVEVSIISGNDIPSISLAAHRSPLSSVLKEQDSWQVCTVPCHLQRR